MKYHYTEFIVLFTEIHAWTFHAGDVPSESRGLAAAWNSGQLAGARKWTLTRRQSS